MIPFVDLKAQYRSVKVEVDAAVASVLESGHYVLGDEVAAFEREFATYSHAGHSICTNSGSSAVHLALLAAGVGPGDEVITTTFTFVATVAAITYTGARPILADIDARSFTIDVDQIEKLVTPRTKAILPVHLYGQTADMDPILELARRHGLLVIEDAAQAHGAEYNGRRAGSLGDLSCFSFYPAKNLGACGEGGAVTTSDDAFDRRVRMLRDWGAERKYEHLLKGYNYRMDNIQGAILRVKLRRLEEWTEARRAHARHYRELLQDTPDITVPEELPGRRHVYSVFGILAGDRAAAGRRLSEQSVGWGIHYPVPVHLLPAYADLGYGPGDFPIAEQAARCELSLPMFAELTDEQIAAVCDSLQDRRSP